MIQSMPGGRGRGCPRLASVMTATLLLALGLCNSASAEDDVEDAERTTESAESESTDAGGAQNCEKARTGYDFVECLGHRLIEAERPMWRAISERTLEMSKAADGTYLERGPEPLLKAQMAWLEYREAECDLYGQMNGGASIWVTVAATECRVEMTLARAKQLGATTP